MTKVVLLQVYPSVKYALSGKNFTLIEEISLSPRKNAVELCYCAEKGKCSAPIEIRPFFSMRKSHCLRANADDISFHADSGGGSLKTPETVCFFQGDSAFISQKKIKNAYYSEDRIRDGSFREKLFSPGYWKADIKKGGGFRIIFSGDSGAVKKTAIKGSFAGQRRRRDEKFLKNFKCKNVFFKKLLLKTLDFDACGKIAAGFHWFESWGRDTMISMPGLLLCTGRKETAKKIFRRAAAVIRGGLLPNIFSTQADKASYNSVDASLWFIWALSEYSRISGGEDSFLKEMKMPVGEIIENYKKGTDFGIKMDPADALITAGQKGRALTWMDAVFQGRPVTPRAGKPVEIQGLWYNALKFADTMGLPDAGHLAEKVAVSVKEKYFLKEGYMADLINPGGQADKSLRPNQIITLAVMKDVLPSDAVSKAMGIIDEELLTPFGLRTLDRKGREYKGIYRGNLEKRDSAYHQGTVWPWLLQFYYALRKPRRA
ncbi:MAG: amylo-alpha-1,6-glucosidase, partial [Elusimicrobiota bacterium]|nr:amylo-alpha-1,6-glucosidase [Elusimicrobiota bacterium]